MARMLQKAVMAFALAVVLAGCGGKGKEAEQPANSAEPATGGTGEPAEPAAGGADAGAGDSCVAACEHRNMARAVSADIIRADCEKECAAQPSE